MSIDMQIHTVDSVSAHQRYAPLHVLQGVLQFGIDGCYLLLLLWKFFCIRLHLAGFPLCLPAGRGAPDPLLSPGCASSAHVATLVRPQLCCCLWASGPSSVGCLHCLPGNRRQVELQASLPSTAGCCF